jgi:ADP-ribose pyrophosphatase YjhB (NUDIX family)
VRTPRKAARVVVLAADGATLLLHSVNDEVGPHWAPPGGGLEAGETPREGAARELCEETGWTGVEPGPLLCTWEHDFTRRGIAVRQHEHVYLARLAPGPRRPLGPDVAEAHAADRILGARWWAPKELAATGETLWPPALPALLAALPARDDAVVPAHLGFVPNR